MTEVLSQDVALLVKQQKTQIISRQTEIARAMRGYVACGFISTRDHSLALPDFDLVGNGGTVGLVVCGSLYAASRSAELVRLLVIRPHFVNGTVQWSSSLVDWDLHRNAKPNPQQHWVPNTQSSRLLRVGLSLDKWREDATVAGARYARFSNSFVGPRLWASFQSDCLFPLYDAQGRTIASDEAVRFIGTPDADYANFHELANRLDVESSGARAAFESLSFAEQQSRLRYLWVSQAISPDRNPTHSWLVPLELLPNGTVPAAVYADYRQLRGMSMVNPLAGLTVQAAPWDPEWVASLPVDCDARFAAISAALPNFRERLGPAADLFSDETLIVAADLGSSHIHASYKDLLDVPEDRRVPIMRYGLPPESTELFTDEELHHGFANPAAPLVSQRAAGVQLFYKDGTVPLYKALSMRSGRSRYDVWPQLPDALFARKGKGAQHANVERGPKTNRR